MPPLKPLLVFGLRGTLLERIHVRSIPNGMPAPDLTVGLVKIWLRPHLQEVLRGLQEHCRLAIWSSTTARNTNPLIHAVFESTLPLHADAAAAVAASSPQPIVTDKNNNAQVAVTPSAARGAGAGRGGRFDKKRFGSPTTSATPAEDGLLTAAAAAAPPSQPIHFEFVWTREHTGVDDFRRLNATVDYDNHATVKNLTRVFEQFPQIAQPENTVLIDDTPSKAKMHAANYIWLDTCEALRIRDEEGLRRLQKFVETELIPAKDVREVLPRRIRV